MPEQTIADGLQRIIDAKTDIDGAIEAKDGTVTKGLENSDEDIMTIPTGATSYSPLTDKPAIDNHTLMPGNNTSSDLGLQTKLTFDSAPTENSTNPVTSGGVYTALSGKQATIDSSHKLSADNVDDTNATNKFATAAQLQQIENNKTSIGKVQSQANWNTNNGVKNVTPVNTASKTNRGYFLINKLGWLIKANEEYYIEFDFEKTAGDATVQLTDANGSVISTTYTACGSASSGHAKRKVAPNVDAYGYNAYFNETGTITISNLMIYPAFIEDDTFEPYALPNTKITPELIELVDSGAKNLWATPNGTVSGWRETFTGVLPKGDYVISFTNLTSTDTDANTCQIIGVKNSSVASNYAQCPRGNNVYTTLSLTSDIDSIWVYSSNSSGSGDGDTATFTGCMICSKAAWDVSQKFVPYRPTYEETVEQIKAFYDAVMTITSAERADNTNNNIRFYYTVSYTGSLPYTIYVHVYREGVLQGHMEYGDMGVTSLARAADTTSVGVKDLGNGVYIRMSIKIGERFIYGQQVYYKFSDLPPV